MTAESTARELLDALFHPGKNLDTHQQVTLITQALKQYGNAQLQRAKQAAMATLESANDRHHVEAAINTLKEPV